VLTAINFRGHSYLITTIGSTDPEALVRSFIFESELREHWFAIRPDDVVVDVGAAYGSYTLAALAAGANFVLAIEPARNEFFDLTTSLIVNSFTARCVVLNILVGAGPEKEVVPFYPVTHSGREEGAVEYRYCLPLDRLLSDQQRVDWIKIDVEGAEMGVLQGAGTTLARLRPKLIIENHEAICPGIRAGIIEHLTPLGYTEVENIAQGGNDNWSLWMPAEEIVPS
jgi:FkbM family methyltransferase